MKLIAIFKKYIKRHTVEEGCLDDNYSKNGYDINSIEKDNYDVKDNMENNVEIPTSSNEGKSSSQIGKEITHNDNQKYGENDSDHNNLSKYVL